ncbi:hypothetical protein DFH94DRAFT_223837 [Russula ochroleuca]|uniref:Uncharacterized protein n=1 Tax=Russula ochroleuca TaxID=152965 RepID=A0A9P5JYM0_9AGAM|nr:hypothetical protein DFH94DRAFT_223837 [Russula ochroleuca]
MILYGPNRRTCMLYGQLVLLIPLSSPTTLDVFSLFLPYPRPDISYYQLTNLYIPTYRCSITMLVVSALHVKAMGSRGGTFAMR